MNANEILTQQHRDVERLYTEFETASGNEKKELCRQILRDLTVHAEIEEEFYYPELEKAGHKELADEYRAEHTAMKTQIAKLSTMKMEDDALEPTMKAMMESVLHHAKEEEEGAMPKMEEAVSEGTLTELGPKLEARTRELRESTAKRLWAAIT
jgi:hemerythrin superfamily protein